jgi:hypothetical protein
MHVSITVPLLLGGMKDLSYETCYVIWIRKPNLTIFFNLITCDWLGYSHELSQVNINKEISVRKPFQQLIIDTLTKKSFTEKYKIIITFLPLLWLQTSRNAYVITLMYTGFNSGWKIVQKSKAFKNKGKWRYK